MEISEYPYQAWPRLSLSQARKTSQRSRANPLRALIHSPWKWISIQPGAPTPKQVPWSHDPCVHGILRHHDSQKTGALWLESTAAKHLVHAILGGEDNGETNPLPLSEAECGVLTYGLSLWLQKSRWSVVGVHQSAASLAKLSESYETSFPFTLRSEHWNGVGALYVPPSIDSTPHDHIPITSLRAVKVNTWIEIGRAELSAKELNSLVVGDALLPDWLSAAAEGTTELQHGFLRIAGSTQYYKSCTIHPNHVTISEDSFIKGPETVTPTQDDDLQLSAASDAPIALSIELAQFEMSLGELAQLQPGEILVSGRAIGQQVALRAGKKTIARGELIDVDGEIGFKIVELAQT